MSEQVRSSVTIDEMAGEGGRARLSVLLRVRYEDLQRNHSDAALARRINTAMDFAKLLREHGFGHLQVRLEEPMPNSGDTASLVLIGPGPRRSGNRGFEPTLAAVEVRDWPAASRGNRGLALVEAGDAGGRATKKNPAVLAAHNADRLKNYLRAPRSSVLARRNQPIRCTAFAYLTGVEGKQSQVDPSLVGPSTRELTKSAIEDRTDYNFFYAGQSQLLVDHLVQHFATEGEVAKKPSVVSDAIDWYEGCTPAPTVRLLQEVRSAVHGQSVFKLTQEQRAVATLAKRYVANDERAVVVVKGGPGTGKSAVALELLSDFMEQGKVVKYASPSGAFRASLQDAVGQGKTAFKDIFVSTSHFRYHRDGFADVLIVDEAHRMAEKSSSYRDSAEYIETLPLQMEELLLHCKVAVFMIDPEQQVRPNDVGSIEAINEACRRLGRPEPAPIELDQRFRTGGSGYADEWIRGLLGFPGSSIEPWQPAKAKGFSLHVAKDIEEFDRLTKQARKNHGGQARTLAGYCWPWGEPDPVRGLPKDIVISDGRRVWERSWNAKGESKTVKAGGLEVPGRSTWAIDDRGADLVGCVYTAQGFEFSSVAVLMGPDYVRRGNRWVGAPAASHDSAMKSKDLPLLEFERLIRNTYRVLMTRPMEELILFSTDQETNKYLRSLV